MHTGKLFFSQAMDHLPLHTMLDLHGNIPTVIHISDGKLHDFNALGMPLPGVAAFYVMDRGYLDFERLYRLDQASIFFVIRAKSDLQFRRVYSSPVGKSIGLRCDQTVMLTRFYTIQCYPDKLRLVKYFDAETNRQFVFLTNSFSLPTLTITELLRHRWQVELFSNG